MSLSLLLCRDASSLLSNLGSLRFLIFLSKLFSSALEDLVEVILTPSDIGTQASELPLKRSHSQWQTTSEYTTGVQTDLAINFLVPI